MNKMPKSLQAGWGNYTWKHINNGKTTTTTTYNNNKRFKRSAERDWELSVGGHNFQFGGGGSRAKGREIKVHTG